MNKKSQEEIEEIYYKYFQVKLTVKLYEAMRKKAYDNKITMTEVMVTALEAHLKG